jgi:hypothetical protein
MVGIFSNNVSGPWLRLSVRQTNFRKQRSRRFVWSPQTGQRGIIKVSVHLKQVVLREVRPKKGGIDAKAVTQTKISYRELMNKVQVSCRDVQLCRESLH